jgi:hypothetical protein
VVLIIDFYRRFLSHRYSVGVHVLHGVGATCTYFLAIAPEGKQKSWDGSRKVESNYNNNLVRRSSRKYTIDSYSRASGAGEADCMSDL